MNVVGRDSKKQSRHHPLRGLFALVAVAAAACAHSRELSGPEETLVGLTVPLVPNPSLRLAVAGWVGDQPAEVEFDVTAPMTFVTTACVQDPPLEAAQLRVVDPLTDKSESFPVTRLAGVRLGHVRLAPMEAALMLAKRCVVLLGQDVLGGLALHVTAATRQLEFRSTRPTAEWLSQRKALETSGAPSTDEVMILELTHDPKHDWPLLPVRVRQGREVLTTTFVLSTQERFSRVFDQAARQQDFKPGGELLKGLPSPQPLPPELEAYTGMPYEQLELAPAFGVTSGTLDVLAGAPPHGIAGVLGADVWGRFDTTFDVRAGIVVFRRPRLVDPDTRPRCARRDGQPTEMECFELHSEKTAEGVNAVATVWRPLPVGGRVYFDVKSAQSTPCRVGVTLSEGDRGRSTQHLFPWKRLFQTMPACAQALSGASELTLGLFDDGPLLECPGVCGFVQDLRTGKVSCECQPKSGGTGSDVERRFFEELYRRTQAPQGPAHEVEPADPD